MVTREGKVALRHWNSNPSDEEINGTFYMFRPQHGVSLAWVKETDVEMLLRIRVRGCCNSDRQKYSYASENAVHVYEFGGY